MPAGALPPQVSRVARTASVRSGTCDFALAQPPAQSVTVTFNGNTAPVASATSCRQPSQRRRGRRLPLGLRRRRQRHDVPDRDGPDSWLARSDRLGDLHGTVPTSCSATVHYTPSGDFVGDDASPAPPPTAARRASQRPLPSTSRTAPRSRPSVWGTTGPNMGETLTATATRSDADGDIVTVALDGLEGRRRHEANDIRDLQLSPTRSASPRPATATRVMRSPSRSRPMTVTSTERWSPTRPPWPTRCRLWSLAELAPTRARRGCTRSRPATQIRQTRFEPREPELQRERNALQRRLRRHHRGRQLRLHVPRRAERARPCPSSVEGLRRRAPATPSTQVGLDVANVAPTVTLAGAGAADEGTTQSATRSPIERPRRSTRSAVVSESCARQRDALERRSSTARPGPAASTARSPTGRQELDRARPGQGLRQRATSNTDSSRRRRSPTSPRRSPWSAGNTYTWPSSRRPPSGRSTTPSSDPGRGGLDPLIDDDLLRAGPAAACGSRAPTRYDLALGFKCIFTDGPA